MPNRFTEVPMGAPPPLPVTVRPLVPIADAFMILMLSRPATGSLSRTWVTPATFWLSVVAVVAGLPAGILAVVAGLDGARRGPLVAGAVLLVFAAGSAAVAIIGVLQRRTAGDARLGRE